MCQSVLYLLLDRNEKREENFALFLDNLTRVSKVGFISLRLSVVILDVAVIILSSFS